MEVQLTWLLGYNLNLIFVLTFFDLNFLTLTDSMDPGKDQISTAALVAGDGLNVKRSIFGTFALAFTHIPHLNAKCHQDLTSPESAPGLAFSM